jgi:hypothetical protein
MTLTREHQSSHRYQEAGMGEPAVDGLTALEGAEGISGTVSCGG